MCIESDLGMLCVHGTDVHFFEQGAPLDQPLRDVWGLGRGRGYNLGPGA